jgi:hypothetical protein
MYIGMLLDFELGLRQGAATFRNFEEGGSFVHFAQNKTAVTDGPQDCGENVGRVLECQ